MAKPKAPRRRTKAARTDARLVAAQEVAQRANAKLRELRARYDAAQTHIDNRKHWGAADALSANAANAPEIRRTLRNRARYEVSNNSYAQGIGLTLANDCIGTGPRLQVTSGDRSADSALEEIFSEWAEDIDLTGKLHTMRLAKYEDGETFAVMASNPRSEFPVQLDLQLVEAEQVANPFPTLEPNEADGILFDRFGRALSYQLLSEHPGDRRSMTGFFSQASTIPARSMLHYFLRLRPGQMRGIPEITAALPLFAQLRRYSLAVLAAAEVAADLALVIQSQFPPTDADEADSIPEMSTWELEKRMATVLPQGWSLGQAKPEQPTTTYAMAKREYLTEIARCLNVPYNVAACDSSSYNYASGRLDHQVYNKAIRVERARIVRLVLNPLFREFISEASLIEGLLPQVFRRRGPLPRHRWFWDGSEHVDPEKEANAQGTRLENNTTTLAEEYSSRGLDWEEQVRQRAKEVALMDELGLTPAMEPTQPETMVDEGEPNGEED